jgi:hypothetical protein
MNSTQYSTQPSPFVEPVALAPGGLGWLRRAVGEDKPELVADLLELYLQDSAKLVALLVTAADAKPHREDLDEEGRTTLALQRYAVTSLREVSEQVAALHLAGLCRTLEQEPAKRLSARRAQVQALVQEYERVRAALCAEIRALRRPPQATDAQVVANASGLSSPFVL